MERSRYPGAKPFETNQKNVFFGRDEDISKLYYGIKIEQLIVLYAKSGMGKSSLLNAGIIPHLLKESDYKPISIRFNSFTKGVIETPLYITRKRIAPNGSAKTFLDTLIDDEESLWHDLKEIQINGQRKIVLIFDQFEELFTYPKESITKFKEELSEVINTKIPKRYLDVLEYQVENNTFNLKEEEYQLLQEPIDLRIILAIRSDRMNLLNGLSDYLPTILKNLYELDYLKTDAAKRAILAPSQSQDGNFSSPTFNIQPTALSKIINFLYDNKSKSIDLTQLQIICQSIEKKVKTAGQIIKINDLENFSMVVENYYHDQLKQIEDDEERLNARRFIEDVLIFEHEERRLSIYEGEIVKKHKISENTIKKLVNAHLLRAELSLQGGYTYELSHDTLVAPILKAKEKRLMLEKEQTEQIRLHELELERQKTEIKQQQEIKEANNRANYERQKRKKSNLYLFFSIICLLIAVLQYYRSEKATKLAQAAEEKVTSVINKIYFYGGTFGLAYNDSSKTYGFIDKQLNNKIDFKYSEAFSFDYTGYAKVKRGLYYYLIDTLGNEYRLATDIIQLNSNTEALDLRNKKLSTIPIEVLEQRKLKVLYLSNNKITNIDNIDKLKNLQFIDLNGNQLTNIPLKLSLLLKLQTLDLSHNKLYAIPKEIGKLTALQTLDLSHNRLSNLPMELSELSNLEYLYLQNNQLNSISSELSNLNHLYFINLSENKITKIPDSFCQLKKMKEIIISKDSLNVPECLKTLLKN